MCLGRHRDRESCSQMPIERVPVDEAMLHELSARFLDLDETRRRLQARRASDRALAAEALAEAESELLRARERLQRVIRAFQDGYIEPEDYREQHADLISEIAAAEAATETAHHQAEALTAHAPDVEEETLRRLADLRAQVLGELDHAADLDALRTLLRRLFAKVTYIPAGHEDIPLLGGLLPASTVGDGAYLFPTVAAEVETFRLPSLDGRTAEELREASEWGRRMIADAPEVADGDDPTPEERQRLAEWLHATPPDLMKPERTIRRVPFEFEISESSTLECL